MFRKLTGNDLFPTDDQAQTLCEDLFAGDPVAERFVGEVFFGEIGHKRGREMLQQALDHGIDSVPDAPESMRELFAEFETVPDWVDRDLVELGASVWRRWGTMLFSVAGVITLEIYTEGAVAMPLSLAGGYAGDNALRRFLETSRFWIDTSSPVRSSSRVALVVPPPCRCGSCTSPSASASATTRSGTPRRGACRSARPTSR